MILAESRVRAKYRARWTSKPVAERIYAAFAGRINWLVDQEWIDLALEAFETYIICDPTLGEARRDLAFLYSLHGEVEKGVSVLIRPGIAVFDPANLEQKRTAVEDLVGQGRIDGLLWSFGGAHRRRAWRAQGRRAEPCNSVTCPQ